MEKRKYTKSDLMFLTNSCLDKMKTYVKVGQGFTVEESFILAEVIYKLGIYTDFTESLEKALVALNNIYVDSTLNHNSLRVFLVQGIPLVSFLSSHFNTTEDGFFRLMKEGMISYKDVKLALIQIFYSV